MAENKENGDIAIGIDLGTTYSCVGVWSEDGVKIIPNELGNRTTPSYVSFSDEEFLVGDAAKNQATSNPENTVYDAKRLIGRKFNDEVVQADIKNWPFKIVDVKGMPCFEVEYMQKKLRLTPEEISSKVLTYLKQVASKFMGYTTVKAVITVPAYFNDDQRQATKNAGKIAGLDVIRIINEPTAAALAYGLDKKVDKELNILVFDCGGGTHDVTLLTMDGGFFKVKATGGNPHLGGEDFDNRIVDWCVSEFKKKTKIDLKESNRAVRRLKTACEKAKRELSSSTQTVIEVDGISDGIDLKVKLSRAKFEALCIDVFRQTLEPVKQVLEDSKVHKDDIDEIVLVGGSTRIPKIRQLLSDMFSGKELNCSVHPDEAVAYGAAVQAAVLSRVDSQKLGGILLVDVTPLSLGVMTEGGVMSVMIARNTTIPVKHTKRFTTANNDQTGVNIEVYEGERQFVVDNRLMGEFKLENIPPAPRGVPKIDVTFQLDNNGIRCVTAVDKANNNSKQVTITNSKGRYTEKEINNMVEEAKKFEEEDLKKKESITARNDLEQLAYQIRLSAAEDTYSQYLDDEAREKIETKCREIIEFVEEFQTEPKEVYDEKRRQLDSVWHPIVTKMYEDKAAANVEEEPENEED